jgi:hypothetical protein
MIAAMASANDTAKFTVSECFASVKQQIVEDSGYAINVLSRTILSGEK